MYSAILRSSATVPVLDQLRIDILMGRYKHNGKITELRLADHYGVSRATIRGVLPVLEAEGLIKTMDNGTKCVVPMTLKDVNNLYDMREYVEVNAVRRILVMDSFDQSHLLRALGLLVESLGSDDLRSVLRADMNFHAAMVDLCGNRIYSQIYSVFKGLEIAFFELNVELHPEYKARFLSELTALHTEMTLSLVSKKGDAVDLFERHIEEGRDISLQVMRRVQDGELMAPPIV